jgi:hypothetical protein
VESIAIEPQHPTLAEKLPLNLLRNRPVMLVVQPVAATAYSAANCVDFAGRAAIVRRFGIEPKE